MLDKEDKKWICEVLNQNNTELETRLTKRMDQMDKRFDQIDERMDQMDRRMDQMDRRMIENDSRLRHDLNYVIDQKTETLVQMVDNKMKYWAEVIQRHFDMQYENLIMPMLREHIAVLPDAYKTYGMLEERVDKLEDDYYILKVGLVERL